MIAKQILQIPVRGMDCVECTQHVRHAIAMLPGVQSVDVFLSSEKAVIQLDPAMVSMPDIRKAVEGAGYSVPDMQAVQPSQTGLTNFTRSILGLFGIVFGAVLFIIVIGEWFGAFDAITERVPWQIGVLLVLLAGYPVFLNVIRATLRRQVIAHTLMTVGVLAALAVGQWATAAVVVVLMRVGNYAEHFTTERSRRAVKDLTAFAPQTARVERDGEECEMPIGAVNVGDTVIVRPGEKIPVDGQIISGQATVDQAAITGESMPAEVGPGATVFAATFARLGSLRIRADYIGANTTFGRVIKQVEEAEAHPANVQRIADKFSAYYLPIVAAISALTLLIRHDPLASAAVLVVACSCSFALATPIAMLASIGAAAKRGLLIKGGKYLESLARADVLLIDKTGTLTSGRPRVTDVLALDTMFPDEILSLAAAAEHYSEHPLAQAVCAEARERTLTLESIEQFEAVPGLGVRARIGMRNIVVGNARMMPASLNADNLEQAANLEAEGKTAIFVACEDQPVGIIAAADTLRSEVPAALAAICTFGIKTIELLTGDNERVASALAEKLSIRYRANLLPEDKIAIVKAYQAQGHTVVMVGDGVNDAPALAQANVGIAMGAAGTDIAIEAAHVALMRDDWMLVPEVLQIAHRTMRIVKMNIVFTAVYNVFGLSLASLGILPPIFAAAAQSLPDIGILLNSSRLLRQKIGFTQRQSVAVKSVIT